jgi:cytochrome c biogenesis protein CcmG/thiol:disulfide interchange protein DsbE
LNQPLQRNSPTRRVAAAAAIVGVTVVARWWVVGAPHPGDEVTSGGVPSTAERVARGEASTTTGGFFELGEAIEGLDIGQLAPELVGEPGSDAVVTDLDGQPITLASLRGQPVWIVFWATWCPPCQAETPDLQRAYRDHADDGLVLIAIDVQEPAEVVGEYMETYGLTYTAALDPSGAIMRDYGVFGLPTHYFIDREGIIRERVYGPMTRDEMEERLASIVGD